MIIKNFILSFGGGEFLWFLLVHPPLDKQLKLYLVLFHKPLDNTVFESNIYFKLRINFIIKYTRTETRQNNQSLTDVHLNIDVNIWVYILLYILLLILHLSEYIRGVFYSCHINAGSRNG